jgi:hypothetical protein
MEVVAVIMQSASLKQEALKRINKMKRNNLATVFGANIVDDSCFVKQIHCHRDTEKLPPMFR